MVLHAWLVEITTIYARVSYREVDNISIEIYQIEVKVDKYNISIEIYQIEVKQLSIIWLCVYVCRVQTPSFLPVCMVIKVREFSWLFGESSLNEYENMKIVPI